MIWGRGGQNSGINKSISVKGEYEEDHKENFSLPSHGLYQGKFKGYKK